MFESHYGLVVGIDDYPKFRSLFGARRDARAFYDWLTDPNLGAVPKANVELVLSTSNPLVPIQDTIDDALERILDNAATASNGSRLYVYFGGHGLAETSLITNLCTAKWSKKRRGYALDSAAYLDYLRGCGRFAEVVMLLDCCRVREIRSAGLPQTFGKPEAAEGASRSRQFLGYAAEYMNAAFEAETGAVPGEQDIRGHFTEALLEALNGAAAEPSGGVLASRLKQYLEFRTVEIAALHNHKQQPEVSDGLDSTKQPLLGKARPPSPTTTIPVTIEFDPGRTGEAVVENGEVRQLWKGDVRLGPATFQSTPTLLSIRMLSTGDQKTVRITGVERGAVRVTF